MDKITKALQKLTLKEREQVKRMLKCLNSLEFEGLDIKKLKSRNDIFRIRKGDIRIIYQTKKEKIFILAIERRNEKTYNI